MIEVEEEDWVVKRNLIPILYTLAKDKGHFSLFVSGIHTSFHLRPYFTLHFTLCHFTASNITVSPLYLFIYKKKNGWTSHHPLVKTSYKGLNIISNDTRGDALGKATTNPSNSSPCKFMHSSDTRPSRNRTSATVENHTGFTQQVGEKREKINIHGNLR